MCLHLFFSMDGSDEEYFIPAQTDCSMLAFAENIDEKRLVVGTSCSSVFDGDSQLVASETICQSSETEVEGHEHTRGGVLRSIEPLLCSKPLIPRQNRVHKGSVWATNLVVLGQRGKTNLLKHDKSAFDDLCRWSTAAVVMCPLLESTSSLQKIGSSGCVCEQRLTTGSRGKRRREGLRTSFCPLRNWSKSARISSSVPPDESS